PKVLLLDEPFSALDAKVRKELRAWLRHLHEETQVTTVIVTHDQEEAMEVADRIVVMNEGHVEQIGSPSQIYDEPATPFVMNFVGEVNVLPHLHPLAGEGSDHAGDLYVRPHDLDLLDEPQERSVPVVLRRLIHLGREVLAEVVTEGGQVINAQLPREQVAGRLANYRQGSQLYLRPRAMRSFR
ncbi:MAG: TOBE-like domain-containing protein, partial [Cyanobacteriota bacterium]|nr:TOBE-like domain-containing protein [Cyanobacteriota bacterium]